jgi:hypothetical protein
MAKKRRRVRPEGVGSKRQKPPDDFVSVARRLECEEDKTAFEEKLAKIAKVKPAPR